MPAKEYRLDLKYRHSWFEKRQLKTLTTKSFAIPHALTYSISKYLYITNILSFHHQSSKRFRFLDLKENKFRHSRRYFWWIIAIRFRVLAAYDNVPFSLDDFTNKILRNLLAFFSIFVVKLSPRSEKSCLSFDLTFDWLNCPNALGHRFLDCYCERSRMKSFHSPSYIQQSENRKKMVSFR